MDGESRVQVFARIRPVDVREAVFAPCVEFDDTGRTVRVRNDCEAIDRVLQGHAADAALAAAEARAFAFDAAFGAEATQKEVFEKVGLPVLRECLKGFNGTVLAYGQTGSGKTHSLLHQGQSSEEAGLLPRLVASLFVHVAQDVHGVYDIEAAAVQVYNEQVDDLLHRDRDAGYGFGLGVQNNGLVPGLTWVRCTRPETMLEAFRCARSNLVYAETRMNKASSRSHAVFQIKVTRRPRVAPAEAAAEDGPRRVECTHARLNVVDLAGSERVKKSRVEGAQLKEALAINKSLLVFGNVVSALAAKRAHVPFRESKLTRILDGSIGGSCKTALLVCVSPDPEHAAETLSTLEFASRALRVEVDAKINHTIVEVSGSELVGELCGNLSDLVLTALREEVAGETAKADAAEAARARATREAEALRQELQVAQERAQELEVTVASLQEEMRRRNEELERRVAEAESAAIKATSEAAIALDEMGRWRASAAASADELADRTRRVEVLESGMADLHAATSRRCEALEGRVAEAEAAAAQAASEAASAAAEAERWRTAAEASGAECALAVASCGAALERVRRAEDLELAASQLREDVQRRNEELERRLAEAESAAAQAASRAEGAAAEADRWRAAAEASAGEIAELAAARDAAIERARAAEEELESELECLMSEVEASAERDAERQREADSLAERERCRAAEELAAAAAGAEGWRQRAEEAEFRAEALEAELADCLEELRAVRGRSLDSQLEAAGRQERRSRHSSSATCRAPSCRREDARKFDVVAVC